MVTLPRAHVGIFDERGDKIDLQKSRDLCVEEVDGTDVSQDNFYPSHKGAFDLTQSALGLGKASSDGPLKVRRRTRPARRKPE